jgi:hypothetical protein|tara:strand:+ start:534 stop:698 length:165 start_codon:yes stop_codon:yes gene_type:complete
MEKLELTFEEWREKYFKEIRSGRWADKRPRKPTGEIFFTTSLSLKKKYEDEQNL